MALVFGISGCSESEPPARATKTYVHSLDGAPYSLDPAQASSIYANLVVVNLYDTLYRYKYLARPYELTPNLAAAMPEVSADGLTLTIRIKPDARFMDDPAFPEGKGRMLIADDFVYSIKRHFDPATRAQGAWLWQGRIKGLDEWKERGSNYDDPIEGLSAIDLHTIRVQLTRPYPQIVHTLAQGYSAIVPREAAEHYGRQLGSHAVGSGPFKLSEFNSARAVMIRNPDFRPEFANLDQEGFDPLDPEQEQFKNIDGQRLPLLDRLVIEFIAEDAARWNALVSGQSHFAKVPVAQFDRILESKSPPALRPGYVDTYGFDAALESGLVYTNFNMADPLIGHHDDPEQDRRNRALRCAIIEGFDWQTRNESFFHGLGRLFTGVIPPGSAEFDSNSAQTRSADPGAALQLLQENGWTPESLPELTYGFPSSVTERQMFEQFRGFMSAIGYPADKIKPLSFATFGDYARAYSQGEVMLITSSWTMDYPDIENIMQLYYGPNAAPGSNSASFRNPRYDQLYEQAATMQPGAERTTLYQEMNQILQQQCVTISGLSRTLLSMWDKKTVMKPDRSFVGGYYLRFVDMVDHADQ